MNNFSNINFLDILNQMKSLCTQANIIEIFQNESFKSDWNHSDIFYYHKILDITDPQIREDFSPELFESLLEVSETYPLAMLHLAMILFHNNDLIVKSYTKEEILTYLNLEKNIYKSLFYKKNPFLIDNYTNLLTISLFEKINLFINTLKTIFNQNNPILESRYIKFIDSINSYCNNYLDNLYATFIRFNQDLLDSLNHNIILKLLDLDSNINDIDLKKIYIENKANSFLNLIFDKSPMKEIEYLQVPTNLFHILADIRNKLKGITYSKEVSKIAKEEQSNFFKKILEFSMEHIDNITIMKVVDDFNNFLEINLSKKLYNKLSNNLKDIIGKWIDNIEYYSHMKWNDLLNKYILTDSSLYRKCILIRQIEIDGENYYDVYTGSQLLQRHTYKSDTVKIIEDTHFDGLLLYSWVNRYQVSFGDGFLIEKNLNTSSYFLNKIITLSFDADVITKAFLDLCKLKKIKEISDKKKKENNMRNVISNEGLDTSLLSRKKNNNETIEKVVKNIRNKKNENVLVRSLTNVREAENEAEKKRAAFEAELLANENKKKKKKTKKKKKSKEEKRNETNKTGVNQVNKNYKEVNIVNTKKNKKFNKDLNKYQIELKKKILEQIENNIQKFPLTNSTELEKHIQSAIKENLKNTIIYKKAINIQEKIKKFNLSEIIKNIYDYFEILNRKKSLILNSFGTKYINATNWREKNREEKIEYYEIPEYSFLKKNLEKHNENQIFFNGYLDRIVPKWMAYLLKPSDYNIKKFKFVTYNENYERAPLLSQINILCPSKKKEKINFKGNQNNFFSELCYILDKDYGLKLIIKGGFATNIYAYTHNTIIDKPTSDIDCILCPKNKESIISISDMRSITTKVINELLEKYKLPYFKVFNFKEDNNTPNQPTKIRLEKIIKTELSELPPTRLLGEETVRKYTPSTNTNDNVNIGSKPIKLPRYIEELKIRTFIEIVYSKNLFESFNNIERISTHLGNETKNIYYYGRYAIINDLIGHSSSALNQELSLIERQNLGTESIYPEKVLSWLWQLLILLPENIIKD